MWLPLAVGADSERLRLQVPTEKHWSKVSDVVTIQEIRALADRIAREFQPDKIILFGSYGKGDADADSDVDLLVVVPHAGKCWEAAATVRGRVRPSFPVDLIVRSPEALRERLDLGDVFFDDIVRHGKLLYENRHI